MRTMAEVAKEGNLSVDEVNSINAEMNNLAEQARALDEESRKFEFLS